MDRDSDESMAPALHTIEHESASAAIKSLKLSPSSAIRLESNVFDQVNGVFSPSFDVKDEINATDFMKNPSQRCNLSQYQSPPRSTTFSNKSCAGDIAFTISKKIDTDSHAETPSSTFSCLGAGDACTKAGTNGWTIAHEINEKGTDPECIQSSDATVLCFNPTFSDLPSGTPSLSTHCQYDHSNRFNLSQASTSAKRTEVLDLLSSEKPHKLNTSAKHGLDPVLVEGLACSLVSSFLSVDECNSVSAPSNSTAITTTAALKSALKTTSSTALTSSTMAVTEVIATSVGDDNEKTTVETDFRAPTCTFHEGEDTFLLRTFSPANVDAKLENDLVPPSLISSKHDNLEQMKKTNHKCDETSVMDSDCNASSNVHLPVTIPASANEGANCVGSNAAKVDISPFQLTISNASRDEDITCDIGTVEKPFKHIRQHGKDETQLIIPKGNNIYETGSKSPPTLSSDALNLSTHTGETNISLRNVSPTDSVVIAGTTTTFSNESIRSLEPVSSSAQSNHVTVFPVSGVKSSTSANTANLSTNVSNTFSQHTTATVHEDNAISKTKSVHPNNEKCLNNVPDLITLAQKIITGNHMQNLPLKVTHTLQEFAASLTRNQDKESNKIFSHSLCERNISCTKNFAFEHVKKPTVFGHLSNKGELCTQQASQHEDALKCTISLENRIHLLRQRLNKLRAAGIARHAKNQLSLLGKRDKLRLSASLVSSKSQFGNFHRDKCSFPNSNTTLKPDVMSFDTTRHQPGFKSSSNHVTDMGILKKDLLGMRVAFDADLTDDSSDEDSMEERAKNFPEKTEKSNISDLTSLPIQNTALWTWAHDRTSVAHRWTWLDAQVTGLEFKIQHQSELHRQLRKAKEKVVLGYQPTSHESDTDPAKNLHTATSFRKDPDSRESNKSEQNSNSVEDDRLTDVVNSSTTDQKHCTAARARPLRCPIRHRRLVHASDVSFLSDKKLKPPTVRNECAIMERKFAKHTPFHRGDGRSRGIVHSSVTGRATHHDHSYHKILSAPEDVSMSTRLNGFMMTNNSRFARLKKSESAAEKRRKQKEKEAKRREDRLVEKMKSRLGSATVVLERADKLIRSVSTLQRNTSMDDRSSLDHRRRRSLAQTVSHYNKRHRVMSVDSDSECSHHRSESGTPVFDFSASHSHNPQYQAVLKRKRATDQAFDINNIVIPHGLTAARIEKLQYKEILTPGWRTAKNSEQNIVTNPSEKVEDLTDDSYQTRHDRYEILEKKKYMAYVEWNITKKNGTRSMSRANLSMDEEASSFFYPSFRASPTTPFAPTEFTFPGSPDVAPMSPAMVRSRRSSSDQSLHSNSSTHPMERRRLPDSISSDDAQLLHRENSNHDDSWEKRVFPLSRDEVDELHKEPIVCLKKLPKDFETNSSFRPIITHNNVDTNTAPKHKIPKMNDHLPTKRSRTDSHTSVMSRDDERHSDDSTTSSVSNRRGRQTRASLLQTMSPVTTSTHSYPKRYKSTQKDDFYYYSELDLDSSNDSSSDEESLISDDDKPSFKSSLSSSEQWVAKPVSREPTPLRGSTSGDEYLPGGQNSPNQKAPPLVLKIKKK